MPDHSKIRTIPGAVSKALHETSFLFRNEKPICEFKNAYCSECEQAGLGDFAYHDLRHCPTNNPRLPGNYYFRIMAMFRHKTKSVFKSYNLVAE